MDVVAGITKHGTVTIGPTGPILIEGFHFEVADGDTESAWMLALAWALSRIVEVMVGVDVTERARSMARWN